ncbi:MAG: cold-shock protein [Bacteroidia bacterium]|nr:cold-shock protein [Bacteroidia bacterium]
MQKGTVKFFNETKGFGFIKVEGSGNEVFVHVSGVKETIRENDTVEFEIQDGKRGPSAVNVRVAVA